MQLEFVPVEEFYFALTLCCRKLEDLGDRESTHQIQHELASKYGQSSTVAAAKQNNFNYTFKVIGIDNAPSDQLIVSVTDWQDKLRLSSDYGWVLNADRKPIRTDKFEGRAQFCTDLKQYLKQTLNLSISEASKPAMTE